MSSPRHTRSEAVWGGILSRESWWAPGQQVFAAHFEFGDAVNRSKLLAVGVIVLVVALTPAASEAQGTVRTITGSAMIGVAGSIDETSTSAGNLNFQLGLEVETQALTTVGLRAGHITFGDFSDVLDSSLNYISIVGEYREHESFFQSGLYIGLGFYSFDGIRAGESLDETTVGGVLGVDGHFRVNDRIDVLAEISLHYAPMEVFDTFANGLVGIGVKF